MRNTLPTALLPAALLAAALVSASASPALALPDAETPPSPAQDAHADLYAALGEGFDDSAMTETLLDSVMNEMIRSTHEIELLEVEKPGFIAALRESVRPVLVGYSDRTQAEFEPRMIAAIRKVLTAEEAAQVAAFYRSDLGRKLLGNVSEAYRPEETARAAPTESIGAEAVEADLRRAGIRALVALTPEERNELVRIYGETPALAKFDAGSGDITEVRVAMENNPMSADEEAQLMEAIESTFQAYFPAEE